MNPIGKSPRNDASATRSTSVVVARVNAMLLIDSPPAKPVPTKLGRWPWNPPEMRMLVGSNCEDCDCVANPPELGVGSVKEIVWLNGPKFGADSVPDR